MAYRGSYRSRDWSGWHTSQLQRQARELGGIDEDVRAAFLALSKNELLNFFFHYEQLFGSGARLYAEGAVTKWRTGSTRMSAQTTERLLQVLPPFLGASVKYDLLRKLRERYRAPENWSLDVTTSTLRQSVLPLVERVVSRAYSVNLPSALEDRLKWLCHQDTAAAAALMAGAEATAMRFAVARLNEEFAQIEQILSINPKGSVSHTIELPYGVIKLRIKKGRPMDDKKPELANGRTIDSTSLTTTDQLLKHAIKNLSPEQMAEVSKRATEEAITLQVEAARADQRFANSTRDMNEFVDRVKALDQMEGEYSETSTFNTASGTTTVNVRKNSTRTLLIVVAALAVLVLLLIIRR